MRTITFRGWDKVNKRMVGFSYLQCHKSGFRLLDDRREFEVMQYTGLNDKNGIEICEGDIVHIEDRRRTSIWGTYENKPIVFDGAAFRFDGMNLAEMMGWGGYPSAAITYEVVGNIWETPELLQPVK